MRFTLLVLLKANVPYHSTFGTQSVDIYVGPHRQQFRVHEKLLHTRIPSFYDAIEMAGNSDYPFLHDEDPGNFDALLGWLYTGNLHELRGPASSQGIQSDQSTWIPHKLYALAHKLDIPDLMDSVMAEWVKRDSTYEYYPHFNMIDEVYSALPAGSPPRKYVAWVMYSITRQEYKNSLWPGRKMRKMMEKHPDLKADFSEYIEEEKAQVEEHDKRLQHLEEEKAAKVFEWQAEERETGIDPRSCNEAFAG
jgi:hypothetical protein